MNTRLMYDKDEFESIKEFPQNRTLYVDEFSDDGLMVCNVSKNCQVGDTESVFEYFKPAKEVQLINKDGEYLFELFKFRSLEDFEDEQLIERSASLRAERDKIDLFNDIIRQIEKNKALRNRLLQKNACASLKNSIVALIAELSQKNAIENPIPQEDYHLLKGLVKHVEDLDPDRKAARDIFLSDSFYADSRQKLTNDLRLWASILEVEKMDLDGLVKTCIERRNEAEQNLQINLLQIHEDTKSMEVTYRTLDTFFANACQDITEYLTIINVNKENLKLSDSADTVAIQIELKQHYDKLSLKNSYSLFVVPGYLGDAVTIREWAKTAHKNKVLMITDFKDCQSFKDLEDELGKANLQGSDSILSNAVVSCNYLLGRKKSERANEDDDVYIPGSGALAGHMANTKEVPISQGVVGKDFGLLDGVKGTRLKLLKSEIVDLIDEGVVPMVENEGRVYAFSNRTLYNGSSSSLQEYPIVRVLDWVNKMLMNYMHEIAIEKWDPYTSPEHLEKKIRDFLDHYRGYQLLFSNYRLGKPSQDPVKKIVSVELFITPFYTAKNLVIRLEADDKKYMSASTSVEGQPK